MGTINGDVRTAFANGTRMDAAISNAKVKAYFDSKTLAALAAGDDVAMFADLPKNGRIVDMILDHEALGANTSLKVGDAADDDRYIGSTASDAAGVKRLDQNAGRQYKLGTDADGKDLGIRVKNSGTASASGEIKLTALVAQV